MSNITVVGTGYVGLANAMLFSKKHKVTALDIDSKRVELLNDKQSPLKDDLVQKYLLEARDFRATLDPELAYSNSDIIIIATPTNYDESSNSFDTSSIELILSDLNKIRITAIIVIKSTVPVGFTKKIKKRYPLLMIIFSPEFLREGNALFDNLYPSRIVIGDTTANGKVIGKLFEEAALKDDVQIIQTSSTEAEAIKLFSNTYLAMRVAYFNEIDTYCELKGLNSREVIQALGMDNRIGNHYNNPSFGYGGYCLPKDTMQLLANYESIPQNMIKATVEANKTRKKFIADQILARRPETVGIYGLAMKKNSDNFRKSAIQDIMEHLNENHVKIIIFEPNLEESLFLNYRVVKDIDMFKQLSDVIIANRLNSELSDVFKKVYTRDLFGSN